MIRQFPCRQERQHILFHGRFAVLNVCRPLFDIVCRDFGLPILFDGGDGNLCGKLVREFLGVHKLVPSGAFNGSPNTMCRDYVFLASVK
jgi:hypothetical protein